MVHQWFEKFLRKWIPISEEDPLLADLIWWCGNKVAVVEISLMVDRLDVIGAKKRSAFLKSLGIDSFPLVIGREWATPEAKALAQVEEVKWLIGDDYSEGFYEFQLACRGRKD